MAFKYDASGGVLSLCIQFRHSVIPAVLCSLSFWCFLLVHIAAAYSEWRRRYEGSAATEVDWAELHTITGMATFFQVFYLNNCYTRYLQLHAASLNLCSNAVNLAMDTKLLFGQQCPEILWLSMRYHLASLYLFFRSLDGAETRKWPVALGSKLLLPSEARYLHGVAPEQRCTTLLMWQAEIIVEGSIRADVAPTFRKDMVDKVTCSRDIQQVIKRTNDLPIPFQYFHLLAILLVINLGLAAFLSGKVCTPLSSFAFVVSEIIFLGMVELAAELAGPFGDQEVDFPVEDWLINAYNDVVNVVESGRPYQSSWDTTAKRGKKLRRIGMCAEFEDETTTDEYVPLAPNGDRKFVRMEMAEEDPADS
eukprot:TRINITY_DN19874_c0_g1_i1.p1 TRINITY_DN19874_c0_g1~~TRINITY_DN19874_c0_g1_i1.p1  ORF type:complete len:380 (+),score=38.22 TRINITY_DN19874_c0_g1_i1:50-1141(+)